MKKIKIFFKKRLFLIGTISICIAIAIGILNTIFLIKQSEYLRYYLPTTMIALICLFYGNKLRAIRKD